MNVVVLVAHKRKYGAVSGFWYEILKFKGKGHEMGAIFAFHS